MAGFVTAVHNYRFPTDYRYGDGYMYPLVYGLQALMKLEGDTLKWVTNPDAFIQKNAAAIMKSFNAILAGVNFDPAKVGKSPGAYNLASDLIAAAYKDEVLQAHGLSA